MLARSGALAAGFTASAMWPLRGIAAAASAAGGKLAAARRRTYRALIEALATDGSLADDQVAPAVESFARWHDEQGSGWQQTSAVILDELESAPGGGRRFSAMSAADRRATLDGMAAADGASAPPDEPGTLDAYLAEQRRGISTKPVDRSPSGREDGPSGPDRPVDDRNPAARQPTPLPTGRDLRAYVAGAAVDLAGVPFAPAQEADG